MAKADLQQITQSSLQVIPFIDKCDTILYPPFYRFERFEPYALKCAWHIYKILVSDDDKCTIGVHNCHEKAKCSNTPGSYTCICNPGYYGDGVTCKGW